jgi:signal transduction histidine kinase
VLLGWWEARHEDARALERLMQEHHLYAATLADHIVLDRAEVTTEPNHRDGLPVAATMRTPKVGGFAVLLLVPGRGQYLERDHRWVNVPELQLAHARGLKGALLSPESAGILRLPRRMAVAGLSQVPPNLHNVSALAVVTSAEAERDRSRREQWRAVIGILLASGLVLLAGIGTLRMQKRALELEQQRALNKLERDRHAEFARANRMATIAALSSGIAHEISTPLGVISGRIEQLQTALKGNERYERAIHTIAAQVQRINTVIRGFLAFARGEAPLLVQRRANDILRSVAQHVDYRFASAEVTLECRPSVAESLLVSCEPALFEQAIVDILINALEASKPRQRVSLGIEYDQTNVRFVVDDEGSGISESAVARVTDPFFTTKSGSGGSGLGLTIAKEILVHHRGTVTFTIRRNPANQEPIGTRVIVQLPRLEESPLET